MKSIFADAGYFIALLNPKDDLQPKQSLYRVN